MYYYSHDARDSEEPHGYHEVVIGCFQENTIGNITPLAGPSNKKKKTDNKKPPNKKPTPKSRDIRAMLFAQNNKNLADTVVIDQEICASQEAKTCSKSAKLT